MSDEQNEKPSGGSASERGKVRFVRSTPEGDPWPPAGETNLADLHGIFGANLDGLEFLRRVRDAEDQPIYEKVVGVAARMQLVDALANESAFSTTWVRIQGDALQLYLLCTCLDALAGQTEYRQFHEWVGQKDQMPLLEELLAPENLPAGLSPKWFAETTSELGEKWLDEYGVSRGFRDFIFDLPEPLCRELISSYAIIKEPQEKTTDWEGFSAKERLKRVVRYLYQLRRNTFTHRAMIVPTVVPTQGIAGWVQSISTELWDYAVYFAGASEVRGEISLLRIVITGAIRELLGYSVDQAFVDDHWKVERLRRLIRLSLRELDYNNDLRGVFLKQSPIDLARAPKYARPSRFLASNLLDLSRSSEIDFSWFYPITPEEGIEIRRDIREYSNHIARINKLVDKYEELALRPRVWDKTKIAAYEKIREAARDSEWTVIGDEIEGNLYFVLGSAPEDLNDAGEVGSDSPDPTDH